MTAPGHALTVCLLVPACFHPHYDRPACGPNRECPGGLTCNADRICDTGDPALDAASDGEPSVDGGPSIDGTGMLCLGSYVRVCVFPPASAVTLTGQIDTSTDARCATYSSMPPVEACVIAGPSITIPSGNTVAVTGIKRLILFSATSITVAGTLDASSTSALKGPAADTGPCLSNSTPPTTGVQGGGGCGGSFGAVGNNGGNGPGSGIGGIAAAPGNVTALTGGCPGSDGANGGNGAGRGVRGHGGGAVLVIAQQMIQIDGIVNASGQGGGGGRTAGGGGGGGSGGMIVLDAPTVNIVGRCFANGGGGGEGASASDGRDGDRPTAPNAPGVGGRGGSVGGGDGGNGGYGATTARPGENGSSVGAAQGGSGGGGGGGGSVGVIKIFAVDSQNASDSNHVSPPPS